jgi:hypothetical protein
LQSPLCLQVSSFISAAASAAAAGDSAAGAGVKERSVQDTSTLPVIISAAGTGLLMSPFGMSGSHSRKKVVPFFLEYLSKL